VKVGDLVLLNELRYPEHKGKAAIIVSASGVLSERWCVVINGQVLEHFVHSNDMRVLNESR